MSQHDHCHEHIPASEAYTPLGKKHARVLKAVLAINAGMVVVESVSGFFAHSTALFADMLDMFGDALGAGTSLLAQKRSPRWQAVTAFAKAAFMLALGVGVFAAAAVKAFSPAAAIPITQIMGVVGGLAFAANASCAGMLYRYRNDNINMKSTFACIRNDMISNVGVVLAAGAGYLFASPLPDIVVGCVVSGLFIKSAVGIMREALPGMRKPHDEHEGHEHTSHDHTPTANLAPKNTLQAEFNGQEKTAVLVPKAEAAPSHKPHHN